MQSMARRNSYKGGHFILDQVVLGGLSEEVICVQRTEWSEKVVHEGAWERAFQENQQ